MPAPPRLVEGAAGQREVAAKASLAVPAPPRFSDDPRIQDIMALARDRAYWMQMRLRNTAHLAARIRTELQPTRGQEETWAEETKSAALKIAHEAVAHQKRKLENVAREEIGLKPRKDVPEPEHPIGRLSFVLKTALSLAQWELEEEKTLAEMENIAATLPVAAFVNAPERKGFTLAGLAVIIGHAGHPLDYPKKGHLWKRLGLAPFSKNGTTRAGSTWGRCGGLEKDDWIELGYKRSRLGDLFGKITQPLLYAQWRSTGAIGPYGEAYGRYKARQKELNESGAFAEEAARQVASAKKAGRKPQKALTEGKLSDGQINARALRYMTKKLISDLWSEWRRMDQKFHGEKPMAGLSPAAASLEGKAISRLSATQATSVVPTPRLIGRKASETMPSTKAGGDLPISQPLEREARLAVPREGAASALLPTAQTNRSKAKTKMPSSKARCAVPASDPIAAE